MLNAIAAVSFAAITMALAPGASPAVPRSARGFPPIGVSVSIGRGIPTELVTRILAETDSIWRGTGFTFVWQRDAGLPAALHVSIGDERGVPLDGQTPLGWIHFDERGVPEPAIHLSYANAFDLLERSSGVVGVAARMPPAERDTLLGRAMGRALAHEMGHYLLASKAHTAKGLMQTQRSAADLFAADRAHFQIDEAQRSLVAARLQQPAVAASNRGIRATRQD